MNERLPFRYLQPTFFAGLLDDPVLLLHVRPLGRSLLVDCGQLHHLAKRALKSVTTLFVTHAHMDHFMGIDTFIRTVHVSPSTFELFGPPGIAGKLAHKFAGYDWNLTETGWCSFRVREIHEDRTETFLLPGPEGFLCRFEQAQPRTGSEICRNRYLTVDAVLCDHKIPSLALRFSEQPAFQIDEEKLAAEGLVGGAWLKELKRRFYRGEFGKGPLTVLRQRGEAVEEGREDPESLYRRIRKEEVSASIGYLTDIGLSEENLDKVRALFQGVTLFICECTYLEGEIEKARDSYHLCTRDVNRLLGELRPACFLPMHLSKTYIDRPGRLYEELQPPPGVTLLRLPAHLTPRPLLPSEAADLLDSEG